MNNQHFLSTPYESGVSLRWDIFHSQFTVLVTGMSEYPEDDPMYGTYQVEKMLTVCKGSTLTKVIRKLNAMLRKNNWPFRGEDVDYYDPDFGRDMGPLSFKPQSVMIYDRYNRKVLGGRIADRVIWARPVTQKTDLDALHKEYIRLKREGSYENGWDNHSTARSLWHSAALLMLHVVDSKCSVAHEINTFLQHGASVSWNETSY
ncbi:hypothetical protein [Xenorhabdus hominickii]|uniref:Uncharacterized protein n=1 Tax=Xenorhabdus hominickii TaxID=351679 RepID=A0A2G0Q9Y1_XENHO|nr:hypothetical protein [Xenorhabdus hominickii]AOM40997.1 hypothetical protein A9255_10655 [Xenorhabdus hominickii]PHM56026.1 hypothetical protein Xhom_01491 [Xenorhabdus hominickii]